MSRLSDARTIGGIGSVLIFIPGVSIAGYILILIAGKYLSDELNDSSIFSNMLIAAISGIIGFGAAAFLIISGSIYAVFTAGFSALVGALAALIVAWLFLILSAFFVREAYNRIGEKLNLNSFRTTGLLWFLGAILVIILVGFFILFIAFIFQVVSFFSIPDKLPSQAIGTAVISTSGDRFCVNCGAKIDQSSAFCPNCGAKQPQTL